jgi:hypothetical protein
MKKFLSLIAFLFTLFCAAMALSIALSSCKKDEFQKPEQTQKNANALPRSPGCVYNYFSSYGTPSLSFEVATTGEPVGTIINIKLTDASGINGSSTYSFTLNDSTVFAYAILCPIKKEGEYIASAWLSGETDGELTINTCQSGFNQPSQFDLTTHETTLDFTNKFAPYQGTTTFVAKKYLTYVADFYFSRTNTNGYAIANVGVTYSNSQTYHNSISILQTGGLVNSKRKVVTFSPVDFTATNLLSFMDYENADSVTIQNKGYFGASIFYTSEIFSLSNPGSGSVNGVLLNSTPVLTSPTSPYFFE